MKKSDFIDAVSKQTGFSKKDSNTALDAILENIQKVLVEGDTISFIGFGSFSTAKRAARVAKVPGTGKEVKVPATTAVKFKAGKTLKDAVANN